MGIVHGLAGMPTRLMCSCTKRDGRLFTRLDAEFTQRYCVAEPDSRLLSARPARTGGEGGIAQKYAIPLLDFSKRILSPQPTLESYCRNNIGQSIGSSFIPSPGATYINPSRRSSSLSLTIRLKRNPLVTVSGVIPSNLSGILGV